MVVTGEGMVSAPQPEAVEAGVEILRSGGNAVDAAIGCAFVQGVVDPLMCGIGGFGSAAVYLATGFHEYIDFHAPAPLGVTPTMWEGLLESETRDGFGFILRGRVNDIGYGALSVPAGLRGYHDIHASGGVLPWGDLLEAAIRYATDGWLARPAVASYWSTEPEMGRAGGRERLAFSSSGRAHYCRADGSPRGIGERIRNPDLATTLSRIAETGADDFYAGAIADRIVADMVANGGLVTHRDLAELRTLRSSPITIGYRDFLLTTNRPPGGGVVLAEMLAVLEHFDLASLGHNTAEYIATLAEVMKRATVDKDALLGDPSFVEFPSELLSPQRAARAALEIKQGIRVSVPRLIDVASPNTTHVSVVDGDGNCVSMTHSLGAPSGVITEGLGFMYNGCMAVFDPRPGRVGSIAPGKARFSAICPSILFRDGEPEIVIGAPGGTQISMGVLQTLLNVIDFGMTMQESVSAPRFSATSDLIDLTNRIPRLTEATLQKRGLQCLRMAQSYSIASVHGIRVTTSGLDGGADPLSGGLALSTKADPIPHLSEHHSRESQ